MNGETTKYIYQYFILIQTGLSVESFAQEQLLSQYSSLPRSINGYRFISKN